MKSTEVNQLLPHNFQAETELIENLIFRPEKAELAASVVSPQDFYSRLRGNVYKRILEIEKSGRVWNLATLEDSFRGDPHFNKLQDFFDTLLPFTGELVGHNARIIRECSIRRKMILALSLNKDRLFGADSVEDVQEDLKIAIQEAASAV